MDSIVAPFNTVSTTTTSSHTHTHAHTDAHLLSNICVLVFVAILLFSLSLSLSLSLSIVSPLLARLVRHSVMDPTPQKQVGRVRRRALVWYPNSGEEWDADAADWKKGTGCTQPQEFAQQMMEAVETVHQTWRELYASFSPPRMVLGGCCRTSPTTIAAMKQQLQEKFQQQEHNN